MLPLQIRLIPRVDELPWLTGAPANVARREEYYRTCADYINADADVIPEECKREFTSISAYVFNGAHRKLFTTFLKIN